MFVSDDFSSQDIQDGIQSVISDCSILRTGLLLLAAPLRTVPSAAERDGDERSWTRRGRVTEQGCVGAGHRSVRVLCS